MSAETLETRAAAEAFAILAAKHPREYQRIYAQCVHPQGAVNRAEEPPLLDSTGRELAVGLRVRRPDGVCGRVVRLNKPRRAAVVRGDDGTERFCMAHRLKITSRATVAA